MKKNFLLLLALLCTAVPAVSQTVTVLDSENRDPMSGVNIYTPDNRLSEVTDVYGTAELAEFQGESQIVFSFIGFTQQTLSYAELRERDWKVVLEPKPLSMGQMVVAASRWQEDSREVATKISRVDPAQVRLQNPQTTADLVGLSNEVYIQKSQLGGGSPMIRGFATNRVLLVIDGVRMNNAIFRSGNLQNVISLDPNIMSDSEIIFGPGSVLYGSDAIGGVMSFSTRRPQLGVGSEPDVTASVMTRYSTANEEKTGHAEFGLGFDKWAVLTSATVSDYEDQRMGSNGPESYLRRDYVVRSSGEDLIIANLDPRTQRPTGYRQYNLMQKVRFRPSAEWDIEAAAHYSTTSDIPRYDRLIEKEGLDFRNAAWYYGPQKWLMTSLQASWFHPTGMFDQVRLTAAFQDYEESRHDRELNDPWLRHRTEQVEAWSVNLDFDKTLGEDSHLYYGIEGVWNTVNSMAHESNIDPLDSRVRDISTRYPDDSDWSSYALFANYKNNLSEQWTFTAGARYNQYLVHAPFSDEFYDFPFEKAEINKGAMTGSLGAVFRPDESWQINATLSRGFRAPNIDDIGKIFDSEPGSVIVPNPNLEPEYAYNADLGVAHSFGDRLKVDATAFYTWLDNAMARRDYTFNGQEQIVYDGESSEVQALQNVGNAYIWGLQAGFEALLTPDLKLTSRINFQDGKEEAEEGSDYVPVRHVAPTFGSTHLTYTMDKWTFDLYADYNGEIPYSDLAPSERGKPHLYARDANGNPYSPSWYTLNLKGSYEVADNLSVSAGLENITDQRYRTYSSGIAAPGTNFIFSVRGAL